MEPLKRLEIRFKISNGNIYAVPAHVIADLRAAYYASRVGDIGDKKWEKTYNEEYKDGMNDLEALLDWCKNNVRWSDVSAEVYLVEVDVNANNLELEWSSANKYIA